MKNVIYMLAVSLLVISACKKTPDFVDPSKGSLSLELRSSDSSFQEGDIISVSRHLSQPLSQGGQNCIFNVEGYVPETGEVLNVLCPGSVQSYFTIQANQVYTGAYTSAQRPMWGTANYPEIVKMHQLTGLLEFSLRGAGRSVGKIEIVAEGGEALSGEFAMGFASGYYNGEFTSLSGSAPRLVMEFQPAVALASASTKITIPVLAGRYAKGFTAKIYNTEGRYVQLRLFVEGVQLEGGEVLRLEEADFNPDASGVGLEDYQENILFDANVLSVGSYNILTTDGRSADSPNSWDAAKACIAGIIKDMGCDIMTLNELSTVEVNYLKAQLPGYEWVTIENAYHNGSILKYWYMSFAPGIIYKPSRLEKVAEGRFWLYDAEPSGILPKDATKAYNYTDPVDGKVYSASVMRCCVWARFRSVSTGKEFYWFASHPHIRGNDSSSSLANTTTCLNAGNIRSLVAQMGFVNTEGLPFVLAGDMNTHSNHVSYLQVFQPKGWNDAYRAALQSDVLDAMTATKPGTNVGTDPTKYATKESSRIDLIWYGGFGINSYKNIFTQYYNSAEGMIYPSDHLPIRAELRFE